MVLKEFKILVFFVGLLGLSLSSCQKEALYTPGGPEAIENSDAIPVSDTLSNFPESNFNEIVDPDDEDDDDEDSDSKGRPKGD